MEDGELGDRVECRPAGVVDEDAPFGNRHYHAVVDEVVHEVPSGPVGEVRRRSSGVPVLGELVGFEALVVGARVVERSRSSHVELRDAL